jgi:hypothetical protein
MKLTVDGKIMQKFGIGILLLISIFANSRIAFSFGAWDGYNSAIILAPLTQQNIYADEINKSMQEVLVPEEDLYEAIKDLQENLASPNI